MLKTNRKYRDIIPLLRVLESATPRTRDVLLRHLNPKDSLIVCDCIYEVLTTDKLGPDTKQRVRQLLFKKRKVLRAIANKKNKPEFRRQQLVQIGGAWGLLLRLAVPILLSIAQDVIKKQAEK